MKIALVISGLRIGGAEQVVVSLADALVQMGHSVIIICFQSQAYIRPFNFEIPVICIGLDSHVNIMSGLYRLRSELKQFQPDVVHSHMFHANIACRLIRLVVAIPRLINTAHNNLETSPLRVLSYRYSNYLADLFTNVSDQSVIQYERLGIVKKGKMLCVHNGIACDRFYYDKNAGQQVLKSLGIYAPTKVVIGIGNLRKEKDFHSLLDAMKIVHENHNDVMLLLVGEGALMESLKDAAMINNISESVRFLGQRTDIRALLSAANVFALSSYTEGFPMVVGEAMASECFVVATDCGGVREFLGDTGIIVSVKDPEGLAKGLLSALSLPDKEAEVYKQAARIRIRERYSLKAIAQQWLQLYTDLT